MSFTVLQFQEVFILLNGAFSCKPAVGIPLAVQNKVLRVRQAQWPLTGNQPALNFVPTVLEIPSMESLPRSSSTLFFQPGLKSVKIKSGKQKNL